MANFFKKAGKSLGKASKFISSNPILSTALSAVPVVGGIASKSAQFGAMLDSKGKSVSQASAPSLQAPSSVALSAPSRSMSVVNSDSESGIKGFFTKAWEFIKKNWLLVIVMPIGLIILFVIVKKLMGKKTPARRRSTAFLAKARAAKAAKRRK